MSVQELRSHVFGPTALSEGFLGAKNLLEVMPNSLTSLLCDFRGCGIDVEERQDLRDMLPEALSVSSIMF